jgi:cytochrome c oxidase assembly protein subunit 15
VKLYYLSIATLISIYLVIVAGGVVRMTGSGMGCPDWPKCFDQYIPPTSVDQLPSNYKEIYASKREQKISRFADFLSSLGFKEKAKELVEDKSLLQEQDFSAFNTWTEYINRLMGALAGLLILVQLIMVSFQFKQFKWAVLIGSLLLLITLFQAWFGAMVVATNIVPWVLSVHMMLAIVMIIIQLLFLNIVYKKRTVVMTESLSNPKYNKKVQLLLIIGLALMVIQTFWGTQVRQQVDELIKVVDRSSIITNLNNTYIYHRSLAIAFLLMGILMVYLNYKDRVPSKKIYGIVSIIFLEAIVGKMFSVLDIAAFLQPTHLVLSMVLIGLLFDALLDQINSRNLSKTLHS